ncbi:hypothetical protein BDR07DRAFT_713090 [Suillus spraguei]|nr:hypothetical protein BDR07DRAFT_713090 [Suillus spraguei]
MSETTSATEASKSGIPTPSVPTIIELASNLILFISAAIPVVAPAIVNLLSQSHTSCSNIKHLLCHYVHLQIISFFLTMHQSKRLPR